MMDENGPKCMKERVLEHCDRSLVAPKDDDHRAAAPRCARRGSVTTLGAAAELLCSVLQSWLLRAPQNCLVPLSLSYLSTTSSIAFIVWHQPWKTKANSGDSTTVPTRSSQGHCIKTNLLNAIVSKVSWKMIHMILVPALGLVRGRACSYLEVKDDCPDES